MIHLGDCLDVFGALPDESLDAYVSDPPAGVAFMSRAWDRDHGGRDKWIAFWALRFAVALRKAKPGAYALTWALPRTSHWTACALENGGWRIQDVVTHHFGQGWPKGRAQLKPASEHWILAHKPGPSVLQIDAARVARGERPLIIPGQGSGFGNVGVSLGSKSGGATTEGSWPANLLLSHCPECEERGSKVVRANMGYSGKKGQGGGLQSPGSGWGTKNTGEAVGFGDANGNEVLPAFDCLAGCACGLSVLAPAGGAAPRCACGAAMWWACPVAEMDAQSGELTSGTILPHHVAKASPNLSLSGGNTARTGQTSIGDSGGASRFFHRFHYAAKASGGERHAGCEALYWRRNPRNPFGFDRVSLAEWEAIAAADPTWRGESTTRTDGRAQGNVHPTVKGLDLMCHLATLITPPGGRVGDLTVGSGGTALACDRLGFGFVGAELCPEAIEIAEARRAWWKARTATQRGLFGEDAVLVPEATKPAKPKAGRAASAKVHKPDTRQIEIGAKP